MKAYVVMGGFYEKWPRAVYLDELGAKLLVEELNEGLNQYSKYVILEFEIGELKNER